VDRLAGRGKRPWSGSAAPRLLRRGGIPGSHNQIQPAAPGPSDPETPGR
jgi:hypothetical protein